MACILKKKTGISSVIVSTARYASPIFLYFKLCQLLPQLLHLSPLFLAVPHPRQHDHVAVPAFNEAMVFS